MSIEIEIDSVHKLKRGDCLEICGIIIDNLFEVLLLSGDKPRFKFSIDHVHGWDVYAWDHTKCDINSGSMSSFLEYNPNNQFTLCFHFKRNQILTILNENVLCTTDIVFISEDITSIKVKGENLVKYLSFSDYSFKSSRVLQPTIHNSLDRQLNRGEESVTIIESRQRIIFKTKSSKETDNYFCSDSENDESEDDLFQIKDIEMDFSYINKILLASSSSKDDDFSHCYPNECPENKYIINYFVPTECTSDSESMHSISDHLSLETEILKQNPQTIRKQNEEETFNRLKLELEKINDNLAKNELKNVDCELISLSNNENLETIKNTKLQRSFKIPVLKNESSVVNIKILNGNSKVSKIPVLSSNFPNVKGHTIPIIDKYKSEQFKPNNRIQINKI